MRAFFAINLPEEVKQRLGELARKWDAYRLVRPANFHITLAFLGDIDQQNIDKYIEIGEKIAQESSSLTVTLDKLATKRDMLWAVPSVINQPLETLSQKLTEDLVTAKLMESSPLPFRPHVKLAYTDRMGSVNTQVLTFTANEFVLFETEFLERGGVKYNPIHTFVCGKPE